MGTRAAKTKTRAVNHVGVTVSDLDKATEFYRVFLESEPMLHWRADCEPFLDALVGYPSTTLREVMFPIGDGYLELLEYQDPRRGRTDPESYNAGHMHLCIEVDDIDAEYRRLRDADIGIEFRSAGPLTVPDSDPDYGGERFLYLRTPDGSTFELTEAKS